MKTIYLASRVHTNAEPAMAEWILVDERHIERAGSGDPPSADRTVDLPGTTIVPGFVDAHVHLTGTGVREAGLDLAPARSAAALVRAVADYAAERTTSRLLGQGFDESKWSDPELPALADLDAAHPDPLVLVRADGHVSLANTAALKESGVLDQPGVVRDE
ncbi:MAG: amidohydrolase family protein, partial [Actinobacteria bacterium]|nr:amidohydrolase family protein [Actinomycetota bacterium]